MSEILDRLLEENDRAVVFADLDDAVIGIAHRYGCPPVALYDMRKCVDLLQAQGMERDEAQEWFDFNILGAFVGEGSPVFAEVQR